MIRRRKAVRGTDALLALSHVHLMEFQQLVTRAQERTGGEKTKKIAKEGKMSKEKVRNTRD